MVAPMEQYFCSKIMERSWETDKTLPKLRDIVSTLFYLSTKLSNTFFALEEIVIEGNVFSLYL